jgi:hypothetical protein
MTKINPYAQTMKLERRLRATQEMQRLAENAERTNGCLICFKPFDSTAPSCNAPECRQRWERIVAA